jgi:TonB-linked SusC/RagA family outer membrane protein
VIGTITDEEGAYRLEGVPAGQVTVEVRLIGYKNASQTVTVQEGQLTTADFQIEQTALELQDIVVTGVVAATPVIKLPFTVERLDEDDMPVPGSDPSSMLTGKAPGVTVTSGNGQPGEAAHIDLRSPTSLDVSGRSQAPLIVIDGVIQSENGGLADLNGLDIEHVEIVKGAAAASLYGARAQAGVVMISTKRGADLALNTFDVTVRGEYGFNQLARGIDHNWYHPFLLNEDGTKFIDSFGNEVDYAEFNRNGNGGPVLAPPPWDPDAPGTSATSFQTLPYPGPLYNQTDRFVDPGETYSLYAAATGRFGESRFRASFESFREKGIVECTDCATRVGDDGFRRYNARLNIDTRLGSQFDLALSGFYSNSHQDDSARDAFQGLLGQSPAVDLTDTGCLDITTSDGRCVTETGEPGRLDPSYASYFNGLPREDADVTKAAWGRNPLYDLAMADDTDRRTRIMGSAYGTWRPISWFSVDAGGSYDQTNRRLSEFRPKDYQPITGGTMSEHAMVEQASVLSISTGFDYAFLDGDLNTRAQLRYMYGRQEFSFMQVRGQGFTVPEVPSFDNISSDFTPSNEMQEFVGEGYFAIASLDYRGRYIADGVIRRDGSSLFGPEERWHEYYRFSGAWRVAQEDFWGIDWWDELKLRYSQGTAGGWPNFFAQYETYAIEGGNVFPANLGNTKLKPEFTREQELGLDIVLLQNIGLTVTRVWTKTEDQLLQIPLPGFVGFTTQWQNAGTLEGNTWEASLRWAAIDRSDLGLTFRLNWDRTRTEITELNRPPYTVSSFYVAKGEPLGSLWGFRFARTCRDVAGAAGHLGAAAEGFCSQYGDQFQVNDDGYLVWVGEENGWTDGIARGLWGTSAAIDGTTFQWGLPITRQAQRRTCLRDHPEDEGIGDECPLSDFLPTGRTTPDWNGSFLTNLRWQGLSVALLLDAVVGHDVRNSRRGGARNGYQQRLLPEGDQANKTDAYKKPLEYYTSLGHTAGSAGSSSYFLEDGTWVKIRELSIGYSLPRSFLDNVFKGTVDRLTINLIGRNLFTFTGYEGYDPEVGRTGDQFGSPAIERSDWNQYPNFRTITASLEVVF